MEEKEVTVQDNNTEHSVALVSQEEIITKLDTISNEKDLKELMQLFNFNLAKKDMARANLESELLDSILQEVNIRVTKRPGELTNKELLDYMTAMQSNIDRTQKSVQTIGDNPAIYNVSSNTNNVNINILPDGESLSKDSRDRIAKAVQEMLNNLSSVNKQTDIIDATDAEE